MVFSAELSQPEVAVSQYGTINVGLQAKPLIQGTTVKDYILFNIKVQIINCTRSTVQSLLNNLSNELMFKVDTLLAPLNGQIDDSSTSNYSYSTVGLGVVTLKVQPRLLVQGTTNPDEIVFIIEVDLVNCNRSRLLNIFSTLASQIMDKVNDVL
ncbi:MAG: hypothetical protein HC836_24740 [Richelia sp. RM2_1_2]|nr:hypothetical protein [Richelia sp. RM2_1_2]